MINTEEIYNYNMKIISLSLLGFCISFNIVSSPVSMSSDTTSTSNNGERPCGERRIFSNGAELNRLYDDEFHYEENGTVTLSNGFIGNPGFSLRPNTNCSQTKPFLEELVSKHAPQIRHAKNENHHLSSVDWYFDRSRLSESNIVRVKYCDINLVFYRHINYQNGIEEIRTITNSVNDSNIIQNVAEGNITSLTTRQGYSTRPGYREGATVYVRIRSLDHLNISAFEDGIEIQYHYFYPWNGDQGEDIIPCTPDADHEGDWEAVGVVLNRDYEVLGYTHSVHGSVYFALAPDVNKEPQGHPILYSANESHAMYRRTGFNHPSAPLRDRCDNDGYHFNSWEDGKYEIISIDPEISNTAVFPSNPNWINFEGRWGSYPLGPVGPAIDKRVTSFWNYNFANIRSLISNLTGGSSCCGGNSSDLEYLAEISDLSEQATFGGDSLDMQYLLDSINNSSYQFDKNPLLEGNTMNIYDGEQYQLIEDNSKQSFPIFSEECNELLTKTTQEIILMAEYQISECKVSIEFNESSYGGQLVKWGITLNTDAHIFEQHKNAITLNLDYLSEDSTTLEISAEYVQSCELMFAGSIHLIIPPCETESLNARMRTINNDQNKNLEDTMNIYQEEQPQVLEEGNHKIYPNPTNDKLFIELTQREQKYKNLSVEIYDNMGKQMDDLSLSVINDSKLEIDLGNYKQGLYLIKVFDSYELLLLTKIIK